MVQERVNAFENFLQEHYENRIDNLKNVSQGAFIEIDYSKVKQFNGILADDLKDKPTESIKDLETALKQLTDLPQVQVIIEQ